jgi:protein tyrosine/serine phosphatase
VDDTDAQFHAEESSGHVLFPTMSAPEWPPELAGFVNFRDLGGLAVKDGVTRHGRIFRSDSLAHAGDAHVAHLVEERGVRTLIDLRGVDEVDAFPTRSLADAGVTIHHLPLIDPARRRDAGLRWSTMTLLDLYEFLLRDAGDRFVGALRVVADPANHPVVFQCAAGKDRTGMLAALVLGLLGVSDDAIAEDYARSAGVVDQLVERARTRAALADRPANNHLMTAEADTMHGLLAWLHDHYGSVEQYALGNGLAPEAVATLRSTMIEPS